MTETSLKTRVIPVLLLRDGALVRSRQFKMFQITGDPYLQVERFSEWNVDELIYLDISRSGIFDIGSTGSTVIGASSGNKKYYEKKPQDMYEFVEYLSKKCFMPLAFGGGIKSIEQVNRLLQSGADKVVLNTHAFKNPELVRESAEAFGSQCIIVSMDCKKTALGYEVFIDGGKVSTGVSALEWAKRAEDLGAGELLVNSIDRDGMSSGFDFDLYRPIIAETRIPVIICGGVGRIEHFDDAYQALKPHALAAANIFHFIEQSYLVIKDHLNNSGVNVRRTGRNLS